MGDYLYGNEWRMEKSKGRMERNIMRKRDAGEGEDEGNGVRNEGGRKLEGR